MTRTPETRPAQGPFHVTAFGLRLCSDLFAPAFRPSPPGESDVRVLCQPPAAARCGETAFDFETGRHDMVWPGIGAFRIEGPDRVVITPEPDVPTAMLELPLIGPVMALLLHTRGDVVLHASAVSVHGQAVVLLGDKGAGKSTTAAAFVRAGHPLLSDDVVVIRDDASGRPCVQPAFARMKLSAEAAQALALEDTVLGPIGGVATDKRLHDLAPAMATGPAPLAAIHVLDRGPEAAVYDLPGPAAIAQMMRFSYAARFGRAALAGPAAAGHFARRARIADRIGVSCLTMPTGLDRLPGAVAFVEGLTRRDRARPA